MIERQQRAHHHRFYSKGLPGAMRLRVRQQESPRLGTKQLAQSLGKRIVSKTAQGTYIAPFIDVDGDNSFSPSDALDVINAINAGQGGEGESFAAGLNAAAAGANNPQPLRRRVLHQLVRLIRASKFDPFPVRALVQRIKTGRFVRSWTPRRPRLWTRRVINSSNLRPHRLTNVL